MRPKLALLVVGLALVPAASAAVGLRATLRAPAADPVINVKWWYSIKATDLKGKPLKAKLTAEVIALGTSYPVDYGPSKPLRPITNWPFKGTFRDYIIFPPESRGFTLTLRWTIKSKLDGETYKKVLKRKVTLG